MTKYHAKWVGVVNKHPATARDCTWDVCVTPPLQEMVTGHFGHKTLRHQDTLGHFGTGFKTLRHQKHGTRHFNTIEEKPGQFDAGQFRWDTAPPKPKLRHQFCGAEVSCGRSVQFPRKSPQHPYKPYNRQNLESLGYVFAAGCRQIMWLSMLIVPRSYLALFFF